MRKFGFAMLETPTNIEIKNCKILHQRAGIFVGGSNNVHIDDNNFSDNYDDTDKNRFGIFLGPPPDGGDLRLDTVHGGLVESNAANNEAIGIDIRDSDSIVVRNNTASGNSAWGISLLNTSHSQASNNTVRDNSVAGDHLSNSVQNRLTNNTFANNGKNLRVEGKSDGNVVAGIHMISTEFNPLAMVLSQ